MAVAVGKEMGRSFLLACLFTFFCPSFRLGTVNYVRTVASMLASISLRICYIYIHTYGIALQTEHASMQGIVSSRPYYVYFNFFNHPAVL